MAGENPNHFKYHVVGIIIKCAPCCRSRICPFIEESNTFENKDKSETFDIRKEILNCSSSLVVYLRERKSCSKQYLGSTFTPFRTCLNNYKIGPQYPNKGNVYQEQFHRDFSSDKHNRMKDWKITIIDRAETFLELRLRESYWQHSLDTFISNRLNERFVDTPML